MTHYIFDNFKIHQEDLKIRWSHIKIIIFIFLGTVVRGASAGAVPVWGTAAPWVPTTSQSCIPGSSSGGSLAPVGLGVCNPFGVYFRWIFSHILGWWDGVGRRACSFGLMMRPEWKEHRLSSFPLGLCPPFAPHLPSRFMGTLASGGTQD